MRNYKGSFDRTGEISREPNKRIGWLEDLAEKLALQESTERVKTASRQSTAVEVARTRYNTPQPSIYEMMSTIISAQKPKFSSVDEAVKHYQESTGLAQYIKAQKTDDMSVLATVISQAAAEKNDVGNGDVIQFPKNKSFAVRQMSWLTDLVKQLHETGEITSEEQKILEHIAENGSTEMDDKMQHSPRDYAKAILEGDDNVFSMIVSDPDDDPDGGGAGMEGVLLELPFEEEDEAATDDTDDSNFGYPTPKDSDPKLDYALKMLSMYEELLHKIEMDTSLDPVNYRNFKREYSQEMEKLKRMINRISGEVIFEDSESELSTKASLDDVFRTFYARGSKKKV